MLALFLALRHGPRLTAAVAHQSDEVLLLSIVGVTFLVAGIAEGAGVSAAVGAFLVGVAIADPVSARAATLIGPLRDLFAALFFFLFGLQIDAGDLGPVLAPPPPWPCSPQPARSPPAGGRRDGPGSPVAGAAGPALP